MLDTLSRPSPQVSPAIGNDNPADASKKICENCNGEFTPRAGSGGKPQRFCGEDCRRQYHADSQRGPTPEPKQALAVIPAQKKPATEPEPENEFDWNTDSSVVLNERPATAVYFNNAQDLVIRQKQPWDSEDAFVYIPRDAINEFLDRLTDACGIPSVGKSGGSR